MIKKISALVLALVLCLSVVVVPASALDLADGKDMAFELKWDKEYYNPGDTATLSVYMKVTDDMQLGTGSFVIGLKSAQITQADNPTDDLKANAVASDLWNSFWKDPSQLTISWLAPTIAEKVEAANAEAEKNIYDQYMKIVINRNTADGSHENATNLKYGLPGSDINAIEEPIITFSYVVSADAEKGTSLVAGITSGSTSCSPAQTAFKYIKAPGASTTANVAASAFDCSAAAATATVGEPVVAPTIKASAREQIRFRADGKGAYLGTFDYRIFAEIDLGSFTQLTDANLLMAGFAFAKGENPSIAIADVETAVKAKIADSNYTPTGFSLTTKGYVSNDFEEGKNMMACVVKGIPDEAKGNKLVAVGYIAYRDDKGEVQVATFDAAKETQFSNGKNGLYDTYYSKQFGA